MKTDKFIILTDSTTSHAHCQVGDSAKQSLESYFRIRGIFAAPFSLLPNYFSCDSRLGAITFSLE